MFDDLNLGIDLSNDGNLVGPIKMSVEGFSRDHIDRALTGA
jgi:hypothetical protein